MDTFLNEIDNSLCNTLLPMPVVMSPKCLRVREGRGGGNKKYRVVTPVHLKR